MLAAGVEALMTCKEQKQSVGRAMGSMLAATIECSIVLHTIQPRLDRSTHMCTRTYTQPRAGRILGN